QLTRLRVRSGGRHRILTAYAVGPDGRRIEASSLRGREVRFRQLEVGATVVLQYRIEERPESYLAGHMSRRWWFQAPGYQTHRGRWVLWMPKGAALHEETLGPVKRDERAEGDRVRLAWSAEDTPPIVVEPGMPNPSEWAAHVVMSTVPDWEMFWKWEKALLQDAFRESPELVALAERLKKDAPDRQTVVDRIHAYLMSDIRYEQDYEGVIAGVKPHAAPQVVARRYGDCKDKAVLFITLARLAGIDVHFALVRTRDAGPVVRAVPMQQFNHAIVYVPAQEGIAEGRFYDPTVDALDVEVLRQDDQGTWSLVFDPDAGEHAWREIPFQPPALDFTRSDTVLRVAADGAAKGELELSAQGRGGQVLRVASRNPEKFGQLLQNQVAAAYPAGRLLGFGPVQVEDVMQPARLRLAIESPGLGKREGAQLRVPLPMGWNPGPWFRLESRRHPLLLGAPRSFQWRFEIELPAGARDLKTPPATEVAARCLTFERRFETKGTKVVAELSATIACERILPEEYAAHRDAAERIVELLDQDITMTVKGDGKGAARAAVYAGDQASPSAPRIARVCSTQGPAVASAAPIQ
ncbi:MAG: transglutaminase domain-containing protein, partial [Myxococcales bacterium]|nr:transglutaminase domain-containing protein [Myxococcales bacterium]